MRRIVLPVAVLALALSTGAAMAQTGGAQTGGASGTSGGAAAKSGSDATTPIAGGAKAGMAKPVIKAKKKKKQM
jgi:hypothetical protein